MSRTPTVIKAGLSGERGGLGLRQFCLNDVLAEAQSVMRQARASADAIIAEAKRQDEEIRNRARNEGYQSGFAQGIEEGRAAGHTAAQAEAREKFEKQQASLIESCQKVIADIDAHRAHWRAAARQDLVELSLAIARRVVGCVGERERQAVLANLDKAVQLAGVRSDVTIAVNPADTETARLFAESLVARRQEWTNIRVIDEQEVRPGGCRVQWGTGLVDATLDTQLARIEDELRTERPAQAEE
ncbi:MAG: hypothetical protein GXY44_06605 [Phycisphaerales bacterium]|nr:hypothetical protein [Phycisphaerales bacterium]